MTEYGINTRIESETELKLEKIFLAPINRVFEMFTDTEYLKHFWAPLGWKLTHTDLNFQKEGEWFYGLENIPNHPNAEVVENWGLSVFKKIEAPHLIEMVDYVTDAKGEINRELPASKTTIQLTELDAERTIISGTKTFNSPEDLDRFINQGMREDIASRWEKLSQYLATQN